RVVVTEGTIEAGRWPRRVQREMVKGQHRCPGAGLHSACEAGGSSARTTPQPRTPCSATWHDEGEVMATRRDIRAITREAQSLPGGALILGGLLLLIVPLAPARALRLGTQGDRTHGTQGAR